MEDSMDKAMVIKAMENIEEKLSKVDRLATEMTARTVGFRATLGDIAHYINNARQIASSVKVLVEMDA
jgi:hypothetical protein